MKASEAFISYYTILKHQESQSDPKIDLKLKFSEV